jgi:hypothetical protein
MMTPREVKRGWEMSIAMAFSTASQGESTWDDQVQLTIIHVVEGEGAWG